MDTVDLLIFLACSRTLSFASTMLDDDEAAAAAVCFDLAKAESLCAAWRDVVCTFEAGAAIVRRSPSGVES